VVVEAVAGVAAAVVVAVAVAGLDFLQP